LRSWVWLQQWWNGRQWQQQHQVCPEAPVKLMQATPCSSRLLHTLLRIVQIWTASNACSLPALVITRRYGSVRQVHRTLARSPGKLARFSMLVICEALWAHWTGLLVCTMTGTIPAGC
jgi:hypothetical protein